jgi:hypothetical protein
MIDFELVLESFSCNYHSAYLAIPGESVGTPECWIGQKNGLCGTALPSQICFNFGPHTGAVKMRVVYVNSSPPRLDEKWEDVVESAFIILHQEELYFSDWDGETYGDPIPFEPGEYRVRFCALKYGVSERPDPSYADPVWTEKERIAAIPYECYELTIWKEAVRPDEIIKVTSPHARWLHKSRQEKEAKLQAAKD